MKRTILLFFAWLLAMSALSQSETIPYLYLEDKNGDVEVIQFTYNGSITIIGNLIQVDTPEGFVEYDYDEVEKFYFKYHYLITLNDNPLNTADTLAGAGIYAPDTPIEVSATFNNECYTFVSWTEGDSVVSVNPDYFFFVFGPRTLTANLAPIPHEIVLNVNPLTGGTTEGGGFHDCESTITVTAIPEYGYEFINWTEGGNEVSNMAAYTFEVNAPRILTANFALKTYEILLYSNPSAGGATSGGGTYTHGDTATVYATPNDCYEFVKWTNKYGNDVSTENPFLFPVTQPDTLIAVFHLKTCEITVVAHPPGLGMATGGGSFNCGAMITVVAGETNNPCTRFTHWAKDNDTVSYDLSYYFEVTDDYCLSTLVAHFEVKTLGIFVEANPEGGGEVEGNGTYNCGTPVTVTATADECYSFVNWTLDGDEVSNQMEYTFTVTPDLIELFPDGYTLIAHFEIKILGIFIEANPTDGGTASGSGNYNCGEVIELLATPEECYRFVNWTTTDGEVVSPLDTLALTVISDTTLIANFEKIPQIVIVSASPTEGGTATGDGNFFCGEEITITAEADTCYSFLYWTENDVPIHFDPEYIFILGTSDRDLVAHFELDYYDVTVSANPTGGGMVTGGGSYACGATVTLVAEADTCYTFLYWTENEVPIYFDLEYTFIVGTSDHDLMAHFEVDYYDVFVSTSPTDGGTIIGGENYYCGEQVTLVAEADTCYSFLYWTENDVPIHFDPEYIFILGTSDRDLVAHFELDYYDVTVSINQLEGGTVTGGGNFYCGEQVTVIAEADTCYTFLYWAENGIPVHYELEYEFVLGASDRNLIAHFDLDFYDVTASANPTGGGTVTGGGSYVCGAPVTLVAEADTCYTFLYWTENDIPVYFDLEYTFTLGTSDRNLVAQFELDYYDVTVSVNPPEGGTVIGGGNYYCGEQLTVIAEADTCYTFLYWAENGIPVHYDLEYTFTLGASDRDLAAHFELDYYDVTLSANPSGGGTVTGSGNYYCGEVGTVIAEADTCYTFLYWTENNIPIHYDLEYEFVLGTSDRVFVAHFELDYYDVTVSSNLSEGGTTTGGGNYYCGEQVTVIAEADTCYTFLHWTENDIPVYFDLEYTFTLGTSDRNLVAHFELDYYDVTVSTNPTGGGTVTGSGNYYCGETVTITAVTDTCHTFLYWTENNIPVHYDLEYELVLGASSREFVAHFNLDYYNVTASADPTEGGTVSGNDNFACGETVIITAIPDNCYTFLHWTENGIPVHYDLEYEFVLGASDRNWIAHFELDYYDVTVSANPPEGGTVTGGGNYYCGEQLTVIAEADTCYTFLYWAENGIPVHYDLEYTFTLGASSRDFVAHFELNYYDITVSTNSSEGGTVSEGGNFACGTEITVTATAYDCWKFANWTINNVVISTETAYTFTVTESITLVANFEIPRYTVNAIVNNDYYGNTEGAGEFETCTTVSVKANLTDNCFHFVNWTTEDDVVVSTSYIYEFEVKEDITLIANFSALDFDTYCPTLWCNTFMLDLIKLENDFSLVEDCKWYINGDEVKNTQTLNQFSYSAGPNYDDKLMCGVSYMYKLKFKNRVNWVCSTIKIINDPCCSSYAPPKKLVVFPNPTQATNSFTVENVIKGEVVQVYNLYGICVNSVVAAGEAITMTLNNVSSGVYVIRCGDRYGKIVIIR